MKQHPPATGDPMRVVIGAAEYPAEVIEIKRSGDIVCRFRRHVWEVRTFDKDGNGTDGARLKPARRARGVRVAGAS